MSVNQGLIPILPHHECHPPVTSSIVNSYHFCVFNRCKIKNVHICERIQCVHFRANYANILSSYPLHR